MPTYVVFFALGSRECRVLTMFTQCGTCWTLTYNAKTITVLAIDHASPGFNIALAAMNDLTNGQASQLGRIDATATQVPISQCGL